MRDEVPCTIDWSTELCDLVAAISPDIASALHAIATSTTAPLPKLMRVSYKYGERPVVTGHFQVPSHLNESDTDAIQKCCLEVGMPVAVILRNAFEVYVEHDTVTASFGPSGSFTPLTVLRPGDVMGAFEYCDFRWNHANMEVSPWSIMAGARSAQVINLTKPIKTALERMVASADIGETLRRAHLHTVELVRWFAQYEAVEWRAELLLIPPQWLVGDSEGKRALRGIVQRMAWVQSTASRRAAIHRDTIEWLTTTRAGLEEWINKYKSEAAAINLLQQMNQIANGTSPGLRPITTPEEEDAYGMQLGPFQACAQMLNGLCTGSKRSEVKAAFFMGPSMLSTAGEVGWLSLNRVTYPTTRPVAYRRNIAGVTLSGSKRSYASEMHDLLRAMMPNTTARGILEEAMPAVDLDLVAVVLNKRGDNHPLEHLTRKPKNKLREEESAKLDAMQRMLKLDFMAEDFEEFKAFGKLECAEDFFNGAIRVVKR